MPLIQGLIVEVRRHDNLVVRIHGHLGVVGLDESLGGPVPHDAAVGVGEVFLFLGFGRGVRGLAAILGLLALGHVKVDDKSNEIRAIPELLRMLDLKGCLVTVDAMGCQRDIAKDILDAGADYLLAVKGNQGRWPKISSRSSSRPKCKALRTWIACTSRPLKRTTDASRNANTGIRTTSRDWYARTLARPGRHGHVPRHPNRQ